MITLALILVWLGYSALLYMAVFWLLVFLEKGTGDEIKPIKNYRTVTIAIPAYNEEKTIRETIESALKLDYPKEKVEIIVINDGSSDGTKFVVERIIRERKDRRIILINQINQGKGAALNNALKKASGEIFIPFDADSTIREDALQRIIPEFDLEDMGAVLPLMKVKDPKNLLEKIQWCEYLINLFYKKLMSSLDCVSVAPGPFSAYRKSIIQKIGGFDEKNLTEDLEISLRLQKHHYKLKQLFSTEVYTNVPKTFKSFYRQRNRWYKGTIVNAFHYRQMALNREYGDFAFIQMPRLIVESALVLMLFIYLSYSSVIKPLVMKIYHLSLIDYEISIPISNYLSSFRFIDLDISNIFHGLAFSVVAILLIYYAHKHTKEPLRKYGLITIPAYLLSYSILAGIAIIGVFYDLARGKVQKW
ncbi:MAG TPA: glycosyltransferase [Candidatus Nanoarchaeia archaeon]|nr:glycosyltransferase [Candidatus Nanoarchaeia archaeon]